MQDAGYAANEPLTNMYTEYRPDRPGIGFGSAESNVLADQSVTAVNAAE